MKKYQVVSIVIAILVQILTTADAKIQKFHRNSCHKEANFKANGKNFMIKASSSKLISTINAPFLAHCARSCIRKDRCKSMVFKKKSTIMNENNCQILIAEKSEFTIDDTETSTGWKYYHPLKQACKFNCHVKERESEMELK